MRRCPDHRAPTHGRGGVDMAEYQLLDTRAFDAFIAARLDLIRKYDELVKEYDEIVGTLLENWKGRGALAFREDAQQIRTNITGIRDILTTMCDTLADCRAVFGECDTSLGNVNRDALQ